MTKDEIAVLRRQIARFKELKRLIATLKSRIEKLPLRRAYVDCVVGSSHDVACRPQVSTVKSFAPMGADEKALRAELRERQVEFGRLRVILTDWLDSIENLQVQQIFEMKVLDGLTDPEIATIMGYSQQTVSNKIAYYFRKLEQN